MADSSNDPFEGIFDNILPEDFMYDSTAITERPSTAELGPFMAEQLYTTRCVYAASQGDMLPIAVVSSAATTRFLVKEEGEEHVEWYERLAQEARAIGATRTFVAFVGTGIALDANDERVKAIHNQEDLNRAIQDNPDIAQEMMYWYLQQVDWSERTQLRIQGRVEILDDGTLGSKINFDKVPDGMQTAHDKILNF